MTSHLSLTDGMTPKPSIERTCPDTPGQVFHVKTLGAYGRAEHIGPTI